MNIFEKFWPPAKKGEEQGEEKIMSPRRESPIPSPEEKILVSRELGIEKKLNKGSTGASFIETEEGVAGIFKTEGYENERAAFIVDRFFDFNLVPVTVVRNIGERTGSFQQFIDARTGKEMAGGDIPAEEFEELRFFDFLIGNVDRNLGNFLVKDGRIFAIDHHLAFEPGKYSAGLGEIIGGEIPARIRNRILQFAMWREGRHILDGFLKELLGKREISSFWKRFDCLTDCAKKGRFLTENEFDKLEV